MTLSVSAEWMDYSADQVVNQLMSEEVAAGRSELDSEEEWAALESRVRQELTDRFAGLRTPNTKRLADVKYEATLKLADGSERQFQTTTGTADIWL